MIPRPPSSARRRPGRRRRDSRAPAARRREPRAVGPPRASTGRRGLLTVATVLLGTALIPGIAAAQKTDSVWVANGDRITGEIKELDRGRLRYSTDAMSTIYVEWDEVLSVQSDKYFEFELASGERTFGRLARGTRDRTGRIVLEDTTEVALSEIVAMVPIRRSFWSRNVGYVDLGLDLLRANRTRRLSVAASSAYRGETWEARLDGSSYLQKQDSANTVTRNNASLYARHKFGGPWNAIGFLTVEQNSETNLDLRLQTGIGAGYRILHTNRQFAEVLLGPAVARESFSTSTDSTETSYTAELITGLTYEAYRYSFPKLDVYAGLITFTSVSDWGRFRVSLEGRVSYEVIKDFTVGVRTFAEYDTRPPGREGSSEDYGTTFTVGYSW